MLISNLIPGLTDGANLSSYGYVYEKQNDFKSCKKQRMNRGHPLNDSSVCP